MGELGTDARGRIYFQYDSAWLNTGFDLSPGTLAFNTTAQLSPQAAEFQGLHGAPYVRLVVVPQNLSAVTTFGTNHLLFPGSISTTIIPPVDHKRSNASGSTLGTARITLRKSARDA